MADAVDVVDAVFRRTGRTVKVQGREFKIGIFRDFSVFSPKKLFGGLAPFGYDIENYILPLSFGKSFMKTRSAVSENGCLIFSGGRKKKQKATKKQTVKHIRIRAT